MVFVQVALMVKAVYVFELSVNYPFIVKVVIIDKWTGKRKKSQKLA